MKRSWWDHAHWYSFGLLRRLYDRTLQLATTKYGEVTLFVVAIIESTFFPVPPDTLLLCMGVARPKRSVWYAAMATVGSLLGGLIGYAIGLLFFASLGQFIIDSLGMQVAFDLVGQLFKDNAFLAIAGAAFTPVPYKVFTLGAGVWQINLFTFLFASLAGRGSRFFATGLMLYYGGAPIAKFIDKWFSWITAASFLALVAVVFLWSFIGTPL